MLDRERRLPSGASRKTLISKANEYLPQQFQIASQAAEERPVQLHYEFQMALRSRVSVVLRASPSLELRAARSLHAGESCIEVLKIAGCRSTPQRRARRAIDYSFYVPGWLAGIEWEPLSRS